MKKFFTYNIKYREVKILLIYHRYNFQWYAMKADGKVILIINESLDQKLKSRLLHKVIKKNKKEFCTIQNSK